MKKRSLSLIFLILFFWVFTAQAMTASEALEQDILAQVKTLNQSLQIYHYFEAPIDQNQDASAPKKIDPYLDDKARRDNWITFFMDMRTGAFWDMNNHNLELTNAGPGMYFAIDPNASKQFGDSAIILEVPAGTTYISVYKNFPLSKATKDLLVKENIISKKQLNTTDSTLGLSSGFNHNTLKNMAREENNAFREVINDIFNRNHISFIEYEYQSHLAGFCKNGSQSAFVFIGSAPDPASDPVPSTDVLGHIPDSFRTAYLFSDYAVANRSDDELKEIDVVTRFRLVLQGIREKGTGKAAKDLIYNNLTNDEISDLVSKSYKCERKY